MTGTLIVGQITALGDTIVTLVSFLLLFALLKKVAWKPLMNVLEERENTINTNIEKAEEARKTAEEQRTQMETQLRTARAQANDILAKAQAEGNTMQQTIVADAKEDAQRIKQQSQREMELERQRALSQMQREIGEISMGIAEQVLGREIAPADHQRLIEEFIEGLEK